MFIDNSILTMQGLSVGPCFFSKAYLIYDIQPFSFPATDSIFNPS